MRSDRSERPARPESRHEAARTVTAEARCAATIADAQRDLGRWLPILLANPADDEARGEVAGCLAEMGNDRASRAVSGGASLLVRGAIVYVSVSPLGAVAAVGSVRTGEAPACERCGELAAELDVVGVEWLCVACRDREVPW